MNTAYVDGKPIGTVRSIKGLEPTHVIVDEWEGLNRQLRFYAAAAIAVSPVMQQLSDLVEGRGFDCIWTTWRTRNLSHRPVAGARKRKVALKQAARARRFAVAERNY